MTMNLSKRLSALVVASLSLSALQVAVLSPQATAVETTYKSGGGHPIDSGVFDDFGNFYLVGAGSPNSQDVGLGNISNYSWGNGGISIVKIPGAVDGNGNPTGAAGDRELLYREENYNSIWNAGSNSWTTCASTHGQTGTGIYGCKGDKAEVGISDHNTYANWIAYGSTVTWSDTHTLLIGDSAQSKIYKFDINTGIFWTFIDNTVPNATYGQSYRYEQYNNVGTQNITNIAADENGSFFTMKSGTASDGGGRIWKYDPNVASKLTLVWTMSSAGGPTTDRNGGGAASPTWCGRAESMTLDPAGNIYLGCNNEDAWASSGTFDSVLKIVPVTSGGVTTYTASLLAYSTSHGSWVRITSDAKGQIYVGSPNGGSTVLISENGTVTNSPLGSTANWTVFDRAGNLIYFNGAALKKVTGQGYAYPPRGVSAEGRRLSAFISWLSPGVTGIETYTATSTPLNSAEDPSGSKTCVSVKPAGSVVPNFNCTISGLMQGVQYSVRVVATTSKGDSLQTTPYIVTPFDVPATPTVGTALAYDSRTATVTFSAPTNNGGSPILRYLATAFPGGETGTVVGAESGTITISGLTTNVAETFTVVAINAYGTSSPSAASNSVTPLITTTPPAPAQNNSIPVPDPIQSAEVISYTPQEGPLSAGNKVIIVMQENGCAIRNITLDDQLLPQSSWQAIRETVTLTLPAHSAGKVSLLIYNGCVPLLKPLIYLYRELVAVPPAPVVEISLTETATVKTPEPIKEPNIQPTKVMRKIGTIYFASGSYSLETKSIALIKSLAERLAHKPASLVLSYGHTDIRGGVDNTLLSKNRARAVAKILRDNLPGQKISTGWFAATKPIAQGITAKDFAKNRRVEIYIK